MQERLEYRLVETLDPRTENSKLHTDEQIEALAASVQAFGFVNPILCRTVHLPNGNLRLRIVAGEGRYLAAQRLGLDRVPVIMVDHLSHEEAEILALTDNRIQLMTGFDPDKLRSEIEFAVSFSDEMAELIRDTETAALEAIDDADNLDSEDAGEDQEYEMVHFRMFQGEAETIEQARALAKRLEGERLEGHSIIYRLCLSVIDRHEGE